MFLVNLHKTLHVFFSSDNDAITKIQKDRIAEALSDAGYLTMVSEVPFRYVAYATEAAQYPGHPERHPLPVAQASIVLRV